MLRVLFTYGVEFLQLLDNHAYAETQAVHQCLALHLQTGSAAAQTK